MERLYPATFPVQIAEMCIKLHGVERPRLVLDLFMGIGTTGQACTKLGIDFVGFEIDEGYHSEACSRFGLTIIAGDKSGDTG